MEQTQKSPVLVIGVGQDFRGDDAVGLVAARRLAQSGQLHFKVKESGGEMTTLLDDWLEAEVVILIDAVCSGAAPGTLHRLDATFQPMPETLFQYSTHGFGVAQAVELGRTLNCLPPRLLLFGIEGQNFEVGQPLSSAVERAMELTIALILDEVLMSN